MAGGPAQSSSVSGIYFQGDGQSQTPANSQLIPSFGNSSNSISGTGWSSLGPSSGDVNRVVNSVANSGPSVGASSLVTDANSALSGGPHLQRSASINTESYLRLPASPISFNSNNISISGSSLMDGSTIVQRNSQADPNPQQMQQKQQQGGSSVTSDPTSQSGQVSSLVAQDPNCLLPAHKKPRLDLRQEDVMQQQVIQQLLQRQDSIQLQGHNPQLHELFQQQRLLQQRQLQQQQILQTMPQMQRAHFQQQQQLRQQMQHGMHPASGMKRSYDAGICARRLMQYIYHLRQRPADNNILYLRKFVAEYFSPRARKRWCLSLYDTVGNSSLGAFPQAAMLDQWHCDICGSKSARGFETFADILPRLSKIEFDSGVIDELLFVDMPHEYRFPSGLLMLEYKKAVQETVYDQLRVVREGHLRIIFAPDLKILSWDFCARRHEEFLPRRLLAPQVNQLVQIAQKYQSSISESGSTGVSPQDLQTNCNMFITAGRQLTRNLDLQLLNDLGFSKRYVRCLQISEVVNCMKDLIDFSRERNIGPIESLKTYPRQAAASKLQLQKMQEMEQLTNTQNLSGDQSTLNKIMAMRPGLSPHLNNHWSGNSTPTAVALSNYHNLLRQNSMNMSLNALQTDASCSFSGSNPSQPIPVSSHPGSLPNATGNGLSSSNPTQPLHMLQPNQQQSSQVNQHLQQHAIQQLLQEMMMSTHGTGQQQPLNGLAANTNVTEDIISGASVTGSLYARTASGIVESGNKSVNAPNAADMIPRRTNSFKTVSHIPSTSGGSGISMRSDMLQNPALSELEDIPGEFTENRIFDRESGDMGYGWKS